MTGLCSKVWKLCTRQLPPFERCCDEHDLAYEQVVTEEDRKWADQHLQRCMAANGYPTLGFVFMVAVRYFGWLSILLKNNRKGDLQ